jgi:hypothetical protein
VIEIIPIVHNPYPQGGSRAYFVCPGGGAAGCGRRVIKLHLVRGRFLCRHCHQLIYASQYERPWQRAARRANKLRQRLDNIGISGTGLDGGRAAVPDAVYAGLLEEMLQAELQAY